MKVSREQRAKNRETILEAASRLFRERGVEGVGLQEVSNAAGMTQGALYSHFESKDALVTAACEYALSRADLSWCEASDTRRALAKLYLSDEHCADVGGGCAYAALGPDLARLGEPARDVMTSSLREQFDLLARGIDGGPATQRREAIAAYAGLVGTLILARGVNDDALRDEILAAGRAVFGRKKGV